MIHKKSIYFDPLNSFSQVRMEFNFEAILKAVENTVARVFGEWIIFVNIPGQVSKQHSVWSIWELKNQRKQKRKNEFEFQNGKIKFLKWPVKEVIAQNPFNKINIYLCCFIFIPVASITDFVYYRFIFVKKQKIAISL